jgi:D-aminoacyl-tRNA deacylase
MASRRFTAEDFVATYSATELLPQAEIFQTTMRAVVQRVSRACVTVNGSVTGEITKGLLILLGVGRDDTSAVAAALAERIAHLRIFEDDQQKMNRSLLDVKGSALVVSQFTLYGDARGQRRPSFVAAAPAEQAKNLYEEFAEALRRLGVTVATGVFGAMMSVELVNEGPVTILLDSNKTF